MKNLPRCSAALLCVLLITSATVRADAGADSSSPASIFDFVAGMEHREGFVPFYLDGDRGRIYLRLDRTGEQMIYMNSLPQGVGSNDLGFDRGQMMDVETALVQFEDVGDRVLLRRLNTRYRADSPVVAERAAVEEAFASSVLWGFPVKVREPNGWLLIDATDFLLHDSHGIARKLKQQGQGDYRPDPDRSGLYYPRLKAFPRNTELEATVTFTGANPGKFLVDVVPHPWSVSVRMHHSFVALPEPGYQPRQFHPESGFWPFSYVDYAAPLEDELTRRFIPRHRLAKQEPTAPVSEAVEPIVYYLDPGTPEPVRSALLDGARWWNQAFEAAGYKNAFQVRMLPADADPMDVRFNVIQWVHRATRGWSYGYGVHDPRTGEIIKGHVTLGSLRVRQDYRIAQGMTSPFTAADAATGPLSAMALARIRQLSAHEVGHTLGLAHNFAASPNNRASVMDYPHPLLQLDENGRVILDAAYADGIGAWDKRAIRYGYGDFGKVADEPAALTRFAEAGYTAGYRFLSDPDARSPATMHPLASLWDNGADAVTELERVMALRQAALARFGEASLAAGRPYSDLEELLVPVYFYHRYQAEAAAKWLGGYRYRYAVKGSGAPLPVSPQPADQQRRALRTLLATLDSRWLEVPESVRRLVPPKAYGYERDRESPEGQTGALLDPVSLAEAAAQHTLNLLFNPERLARLAVQAGEDASAVSIREVFDGAFQRLFESPQEGLAAVIQQRNGAALLAHWRRLAIGDAAPEVRMAAHAALRESARWLRERPEAPAGSDGFHAYQLWLIDTFMHQPGRGAVPEPRSMPPGSPIGQASP